MRYSALLFLSLTAVACAAPDAAASSGGTIWATPHDSYSSSVGVLGCKIDTNRVAYWPDSVDCNNICVSLTYEGRSVNLLRIDQSGGAHDISYDAWNYLYTGSSATLKPTAGGAIAMNYSNVEASACASLIYTHNNKLPLSASNSMNFLASCLSQADSWVSKNYVLYNILDAVCSWGYDEQCTLNWPTNNQATCAHSLGMPVALTSDPVYNIEYPTGKLALASSSPSGQSPQPPSSVVTSAENKDGKSGGTIQRPNSQWLMALMIASNLVLCLLLYRF
ncbi:hypothetical protein B7463_g11674, partial [Scytalidium lignicola]